MDAAAEIGRNPARTRFSLSIEMSRLARDGTAEPVSRDQILRRERGQGNTHFPCSADHEATLPGLIHYLAICEDYIYINVQYVLVQKHACHGKAFSELRMAS